MLTLQGNTLQKLEKYRSHYNSLDNLFNDRTMKIVNKTVRHEFILVVQKAIINIESNMKELREQLIKELQEKDKIKDNSITSRLRIQINEVLTSIGRYDLAFEFEDYAEDYFGNNYKRLNNFCDNLFDLKRKGEKRPIELLLQYEQEKEQEMEKENN